MKKTYYMDHAQARQRAAAAVMDAPEGWCVTVAESNRTLEQNAAQWPILQAFAEQAEWPVDGRMVKMSDEEWKDVLTAAFKGETMRLAAGLNGGVVMLGLRTKKFSKSEFSDWLEFLHATAAQRGVVVYEDAHA